MARMIKSCRSRVRAEVAGVKPLDDLCTISTFSCDIARAVSRHGLGGDPCGKSQVPPRGAQVRSVLLVSSQLEQIGVQAVDQLAKLGVAPLVG